METLLEKENRIKSVQEQINGIKSVIGKDIDEMLKSIILTFEGLKDRIYS